MTLEEELFKLVMTKRVNINDEVYNLDYEGYKTLTDGMFEEFILTYEEWNTLKDICMKLDREWVLANEK